LSPTIARTMAGILWRGAGFCHDRVGPSDFLALGAGVIDRNAESLHDRRQRLFGPLDLGIYGGINARGEEVLRFG
jgi:hypothetical protein